MPPNVDNSSTPRPGPARPQSRDDRIPRDVLYRVMPTVEVVDPVPRDPTLLETLTQTFYDAQAQSATPQDMKDDGKRR